MQCLLFFSFILVLKCIIEINHLNSANFITALERANPDICENVILLYIFEFEFKYTHIYMCMCVYIQIYTFL